jgi:hypothetical protein
MITRSARVRACLGVAVVVVALSVLAGDASTSRTAAGTSDLARWSAQAVSDDAAVATEAIASLRAAGPAGLAALTAANADTIHRHVGTLELGVEDAAQWRRVSAAIDTVAGQRDVYASGLYWYTDFDAAKAAAAAAGKPILSLRLLGKLSDEYSCANSRFFRTVLYANADVSAYLRDHFILHWQSVRPVPVITIDFGDGRVVRRTITGNSIHYVLSADGRVIDAIPGLYGPKAFLRSLSRATAQAMEMPSADVAGGAVALRQWHAAEAEMIERAWRTDLRRVGVTAGIAGSDAGGAVAAIAAAPPTAVAAGARAVGKGRVEMNVVRAVEPVTIASATADDDNATWAKVAALHTEDAALDVGSRALLAAKHPDALRAGLLTASKGFVENPLVRIVANFQRSIAEDTVRNEYQFHRQTHQWLADPARGPALTADVNALNDRVYAELFLTPRADPWLGLLPPDAYSALDNDGMCQQ